MDGIHFTPPLASGSEVFHPLYELHQLHQLRHPKVRATPGCLQERIEKPSRVRPLQGNRHQLTVAVPAVHTLPAPAAPVADQLELFGKPRMEGMRERESLFQVIYEGCNSNVILSPAKEGSMSIRGSWTISTERLRVLELPKPRRGLRSLSTTPAHATRAPPASRKHGFLFRSTRVRTISSPGPSPPRKSTPRRDFGLVLPGAQG